MCIAPENVKATRQLWRQPTPKIVSSGNRWNSGRHMEGTAFGRSSETITTCGVKPSVAFRIAASCGFSIATSASSHSAIAKASASRSTPDRLATRIFMFNLSFDSQ